MDVHFTGAAQEFDRANAPVTRFVEDQGSCDAQRALDDDIARLFATHTGIGAVLLDSVGHVKPLESRAKPGNHAPATELGVYASIQSAIDAAADGDAVFIAAGTYREQLTIRSKQLDLLGAIGDDGSSLVTLECPDVADLDVDPIDNTGELAGNCAVVRIKRDAHVTVRHLIIDGRYQDRACSRFSTRLNFASVSTVGADSIVEYVETRGFEICESVSSLS